MRITSLAAAATSGLALALLLPQGIPQLTARQRTTTAGWPMGEFRRAGTAARFDVSPPLEQLARQSATSRRTPRPEPPERPTVLGPVGPQDMDASVQSRIGVLDMPAPLVAFDALANVDNRSLSDSVGDVGPNHYVAMTNVSFAVFDKTGNLLAGPALTSSLWAGFGGPCEDEDAGDPVVFYDQFADRWILTQFTAAGPEFFNCLAISTGPDPTGTFFRYAFSNGTRFPDYPKYGVWHDGYYLSTRDFDGSPDGPFAGIGAHALNRAQIIAGNPAAQIVSFFVPPSTTPFLIGDGLLPADVDGPTLPAATSPAFFLGAMDDGGPHGAPGDALTVWQFSVNFSAPAQSEFFMLDQLEISPYDTIFPCVGSSRSCITQRGTTRRIDILSYRQRPVWRFVYRRFATHETMLASQSVQAGLSPTIAGIRWWELRGGTSPFIFQEGTFAPGLTDLIHRWMGSIAMDRDGNIALGYSASNANTFPSIRYTGRLAGDAAGAMPQGEGSIVEGTGSITDTSRWGDYTSMNIDPVDDCTFWYVNQHVPVTSARGWKTRVGAFKFPTCGVPGLADLSVASLGSLPAGLTLGQSFVLGDSTKNVGVGSSQPTTTRYYFSTDLLKSPGDVRITGTRTIPVVIAAASSAGDANLRVPAMPAGTYRVLACADDLGSESETDETNNCLASFGTVDIRAADLVVTSLSNPPATSAPGGSFSVTDTTRNQGNASATLSVTRYYLSLDNRRSAGDRVLLGQRTLALLAPAASSTGTALVGVTIGTQPGLYFLLACADDAGTVLEGQEGNNCRASATRVNVGSSTGTFELSPIETTIHVGGRLTYDFVWTVPEPLTWRDLATLDLRIRDDADTILWIRFDEARNTLAVFDPSTGTFGDAVAPGTAQRLQTRFATLYLRQSSAIGSGPTGQFVTLHLNMSFKRAAAGRTYVVEVAATDDVGHSDEFVQAGTIRVTRDGTQ